MIKIDATVEGLTELQAINIRMIGALKPTGALGRAIRFATVEAHKYLISIIHRDTGAYAAAQTMDVKAGRGEIYTDPRAVNPRGQRPADYGPYEERRGSSHAAYRRTVRERGEQIAARALQYIDRSLL